MVERSKMGIEADMVEWGGKEAHVLE